jgi:ribosomal protein S12 methylthiotransferase
MNAPPVRRYAMVTLGCPKNEVDSEKLTGLLDAEGLVAVDDAADADLVVVNTCAFIEAARQESIDTVLAVRDVAPDAEVVVTGCMAERYGDELAEALPEVQRVAGFGVPVTIGAKPGSAAGTEDVAGFDLLELPRPPARAPWAYLKIAEGCDRNCGFCAIPSFRGPQRSRSIPDLLAEVDALGASEIVLVAQDLASYGRDQGQGERSLIPLVRAVAERVERVRLLYLYPSDLTDELIDAIIDTGLPYFDLSLQHVSRPLVRRMRRWGEGSVFLERIQRIRRLAPGAALRSSFIVGYPGETEEDQDQLLDFIEEARLDWCGFFSYSREDGTYAADLDRAVDGDLVRERLAELTELQDRITAEKRLDLVGSRVQVLVDEPGVARSHREAPEIDGIIEVTPTLAVGSIHSVEITDARGPDLMAGETR